MLKDFLEEMEDSIYLIKICRASCPVAQVTGVETYTPHSILYIAYLLATGQLDWSPENTYPLYMCQICGRCEAACKGFPFTKIILEARRETVIRGSVPKNVIEAKESIDKEVREKRDSFFKEIGASFDSSRDNLLIAGLGYWVYPKIVKKAYDLLEEIIGQVTISPRAEELTAPHHAILGFLNEATDKAEEFLRISESYESIIIMDPLFYFIVKKIYPTLGHPVGVKVKHLIEVLSENVGALKLKTERSFAYTYPYELSILDLNKVVVYLLQRLGAQLEEPQYSGNLYYPTGSAGLFNYINQEVAKKITLEKIQMLIESTGVKRLVTASPWEKNDLHQNFPNEVTIYDVIETLSVVRG